MQLRYRPEARAELFEAFDWYEAKADRLGMRFLEAVEEALRFIEERPYAWPLFDEGHRARMVRRFPYRVFYRIADDADVIVILAIAHTSRQPGYWRDRDK